MEVVTLSAEADAELAPLLEARAEFEAASQQPTEPEPVATKEPQDAAPKTEPEVTDQPTQEEPTGTGDEPAAEDRPAPGPDLSWLPENERDAYASLPEPAQKVLQRIRKDALKGMTKAQQEAASLKKDAEFARNLGSPEERAAYFAWKRERLAGVQPAKEPVEKQAPKSKLDEILAADPELLAALREEIASVGGEKARAIVSEPQRRVAEVDAALLAARGEDVSDDEFKAAAAIIADTFGGPEAAYERMSLESIPQNLAIALRAVRAERAGSKATPAVPPQPRAAVIQGSKSTGKPTKPIPAHVVEKRPMTDEEIWAETLEGFGLDRARAAQLLKNGHVTVRGT
jgi:hypothetical protein